MPVKTRSKSKRKPEEEQRSLETKGGRTKKRAKTRKGEEPQESQLNEKAATKMETGEIISGEEKNETTAMENQNTETSKGDVLKGEEEAQLHEKPSEEAQKQIPEGAQTKTLAEHVEVPTTEQTVAVEDPENQVYERGHIHFFFRPKIDVEEVHQLADVARLFFILEPKRDGTASVSDEEKERHPNRLFIIGKKQFPDMEQKKGYWAVLEFINQNYNTVLDQLKGGTYETATRGTRTLEAARPVAHGVYNLVRHKKLHSHLVYVLEVSETSQEIQEMFRIEEEGSYLLQVKNPEVSNQGVLSSTTAEHQVPHLKEEMKAHYTKEVQQVFEHPMGGHKLRWASAFPIDLLNSKGAEILIIPVTEHLHHELGKVGDELKKEASVEKVLNYDQMVNQLRDTLTRSKQVGSQ